MGTWLEARMSPGLTFTLQLIMVGVIVLDVVLGIVAMVIYAVQSKKLSKKLRIRSSAGVQPGQKEGEMVMDGATENVNLFGPDEEEDPIFGFVGMPRNPQKKSKQGVKFVVIPPAVPKQKKKPTQLMRESPGGAAVQ